MCLHYSIGMEYFNFIFFNVMHHISYIFKVFFKVREENTVFPTKNFYMNPKYFQYFLENVSLLYFLFLFK